MWKGLVSVVGVTGHLTESALPGVWIAQEQVTPAGSQVMQEVQIQADPLSAAEKLCVCEISRLNLHYSVCVHACKLSAEL